MFLLFDIGGTKTRFAYSSNLETFEFEPTVFYTKQNYLEELEEIKTQLGTSVIDKVAGGVPGILQNEKLEYSPNLPDFVGKELNQDLLRIFNSKSIMITNDAQLVALGEAHFGAGKGYSNICYITLGTGVGGGIVRNGQLSLNKFFEPGHMVRFEKLNISFEESISGGSIKKHFNGNIPLISDRQFWNEVEMGLALLLLNIFATNPVDLFILGGGIVIKGNINLDNIINKYKELSRFKIIPEFKIAKLGDFSGLYGAMHWLKNF